MADNVPNFDAMTPEEIMAWMQKLAERQGATEGFVDTGNVTVDVAEVSEDDERLKDVGEYVPFEYRNKPDEWRKKVAAEEEAKKQRAPAPAVPPPAPAKPAATAPPPAPAPAAKPVVPAAAPKVPPPPPAAAPVAKPAAPVPAPKVVPPPAPAQPAAAQLSIFDQPDEGIPAPDWIANLGVGNELPPEPVEEVTTEPEPATASLSWLESLAVDSGAALPELDLSSLGKELEPAVAQTPSTDTNPVNWLESLAQSQNDLTPAATPAASNPVNWLESLATEQGVQESPVAASSAPDDPVNWLESLAKRQGARDEELTTDADLNVPPSTATPSASGYSNYTFDSPVPPAKSEPPKQPSPFAASAPTDPAAWLDSLASNAFESTKPQAAPPPPAHEMSDTDIQQALKKGELVPHDQMEAWMQRQLQEGAKREEPEELAGDYDPDAPPVKADLPDWLIEQVGDSMPVDEPAPAAPPMAQTPALIDTILEPPNVTDIPDWLKEDEPETDDLDSIFATPAPENWSETRGFTEPAATPATPAAEPQVAAVSSSNLVDPSDPWVEALEMEYAQAHGTTIEQPVTPPPPQAAPTPATTPIISTTTTLQAAALPVETEVPAGQPAAVPDWLGGVASEPAPAPVAPVAPAATVQPATEASPMPDWLTMEITEPQVAGSDVPDWLHDVDVEASDIPDWLKQTITSTKEDMVITPTPAAAPAAITPAAPPPPKPATVVPVRASPAPVPVAAQNIDVAATLQDARTHATSNNLDASLPHYEMLIRANAALDDVVDDLAKLAEKFKTSPAVHRVLGDTLMRQGKLQAALDTYRKALNQL